MSTIRFGKKCDGDGCSVAFNYYDVGDILPCDYCCRDLCAKCRKATGHRVVRDTCCDECPGPLASCEASA